MALLPIAAGYALVSALSGVAWISTSPLVGRRSLFRELTLGFAALALAVVGLAAWSVAP